MADVFVSYARSTEELAQQVAEALRSNGYSVWRDDEIPAHRAYSEVIEERLKEAKVVVVLWSADAAKSQWVRAEADAAREAGMLVQVSVDGTIPPMPFNQLQYADLQDWGGDIQAPSWRKVDRSVAELVGGNGAESAAARPARSHKLSICVLPFENMSGDAEQEYFSDGISEDITTDLTNISALSVVARNSAFTFKGKAVDVAIVARQLNVSHVLEGSVRKVGNRVRITAQLINGATGDHLWAERYDRDLTDIFAIQDEISEAIVAALKLKLLPEVTKAIENRGTASAEAYDLYLMARQYWITGNHGDRRREERVVRICRRATEVDPDYARAWALMAIAQSSLRYDFGGGEEVDDGVAAAERALALNPNIAEAHCPKARHLAEQNRFDQADTEIAKALRLDPDSWEVNKEAGRMLIRQRRIDEATRHFEKAAEVMESDFHAWGMLFSCYQAQGKSDEVMQVSAMVLKQVERVLTQDPDNGSALSLGAASLAVLGQPERARQWLERALLVDPDNLNIRYNFVCNLLVHFHDTDAALDMLEPVLSVAGQTMVKLIEVDLDLDSVRDDPRFQQMLAEAKARLAAAEPSS
jgi:adenylate cyclase